MTATFVRIGEFEPEKEDWTFYVERLGHFCHANGIDDEDKKRSVFLSVIGPGAYKFLRSLLYHPRNQETSLLNSLHTSLCSFTLSLKTTFSIVFLSVPLWPWLRRRSWIACWARFVSVEAVLGQGPVAIDSALPPAISCLFLPTTPLTSARRVIGYVISRRVYTLPWNTATQGHRSCKSWL